MKQLTDRVISDRSDSMNLASSISDGHPSREVNDVSTITDWLRTSSLERRVVATSLSDNLERENRIMSDRIVRLETEQGELRNRILQLEERLANAEAQNSWRQGQIDDMEVMLRTLQNELDRLRESGR